MENMERSECTESNFNGNKEKTILGFRRGKISKN